MRLSMLVHPFTDRNLQLAAQVGVSDIVAMYPGTALSALLAMKTRVEAFGMRLTHIERKLPHLDCVHGLPGRDAQIDAIRVLLRNMGEAGMEVLCYNWMPDEDWQRTRSDAPERGGSKVTAFRLSDIGSNVTDADGRPDVATPADALWENLRYFLAQIVPDAEAAGIRLALHPDDPPLARFGGQDRIIGSNAALRRAVSLVPSASNGVCYCCGSLFPAGEDVIAGVRELGDGLAFVHCRNVRGTAEDFQETWHDNGDIDLVAFLRALKETGYVGTIRPDHAPSMAGEPNDSPGYEMLGRLYAAGYIRGILQSL